MNYINIFSIILLNNDHYLEKSFSNTIGTFANKGMASTHFVKQSDTVRIKRFPFLDSGNIGPTKSIATRYHGECTGMGWSSMLVTIGFLFILWHSLQVSTYIFWYKTTSKFKQTYHFFGIIPYTFPHKSFSDLSYRFLKPHVSRCWINVTGFYNL